MKKRVLILDDDDIIRSMLWGVFDRRGYEVFTYSDPSYCPLYLAPGCKCTREEACADIIVSDLDMPNVKGLDFVESQLQKGCRCQAIALISGSWSDEDLRRAQRINCKVFAKPFHVEQIAQWLEEVEKGISADRKLSDWCTQRLPNTGTLGRLP